MRLAAGGFMIGKRRIFLWFVADTDNGRNHVRMVRDIRP